MDEMANYVASGWKRDLTHMIGCCWEVQEGPLEGERWRTAIKKFISVMVQKKQEWIEIKELTPLKYMPYVAKLFREVTGKDLQGLGQFTGWIGWGGYYHWRVVQQGLVHLVPRLQDEPTLRMPSSHPSGRPLPAGPSFTCTPTMGASARPQGGGSRPALSQRWSAPTPSQCGGATASSQGGRSLAPCQGATPITSGGSTNPPTSDQGAGDSTWVSWYQLSVREAEGRISEPQEPPFPVASAQVRWESVGQIYGWVHGNVLSRALRAYYSRVDLPTLHTWACQALCMIAEYHLACVTRGSPVTSPILPGELEECLPPIADYAPLEDHMSVTDVRVRDNWARTLHVAMWCHRLDMAVNDRNSSNSLARSCHQMEDILAYFLGPGTAWRLIMEDVVTQVLRENRRQLDAKWNKAASSLHNCNQRQITLCQEIDVMMVARDLTPDSPADWEMDAQLNTLRTALGAIERSILTFEVLLEGCQMQEEEARQAETIPEEPGEESTDTEMADDEGRGHPGPSDLREEANVEVTPPPHEDAGPTPQAPGGDVVMPEEDALLMQAASQPEGPVTGPHSPRSEAGMVSGEMAGLSIACPAQPEMVEDETPQ